MSIATGHLKELHRHRYKHANQLLSPSSPSPYILVERRAVYADSDPNSPPSQPSAVFQTEGVVRISTLQSQRPNSGAAGPGSGRGPHPEQEQQRVPTHYRFEPLLENYSSLYPAYQVAEEAVRAPTPPPCEPEREREQSPNRKATSRPPSHKVSRAARDESPSKLSKKTARSDK